MTGALKPPQATVTTTKRGRRFCVCPSCQVLGAPIPLDAQHYTCKACGAEITLSEKLVRPRREATP